MAALEPSLPHERGVFRFWIAGKRRQFSVAGLNGSPMIKPMQKVKCYLMLILRRRSRKWTKHTDHLCQTLTESLRMEKQNDQGGTEDRKRKNKESKKRYLRRAMKCDPLSQQLAQVADSRVPKRFKAPRLRAKNCSARRRKKTEDGKRARGRKNQGSRALSVQKQGFLVWDRVNWTLHEWNNSEKTIFNAASTFQRFSLEYG